MDKTTISNRTIALYRFLGFIELIHVADEAVLRTMREYCNYDRTAGVYSPAVNEGYRLIDMIDEVYRITGVKKTDPVGESLKAFQSLFSDREKFDSLVSSVNSLLNEVGAYRSIYGVLPGNVTKH